MSFHNDFITVLHCILAMQSVVVTCHIVSQYPSVWKLCISVILVELAISSSFCLLTLCYTVQVLLMLNFSSVLVITHFWNDISLTCCRNHRCESCQLRYKMIVLQC